MYTLFRLQNFRSYDDFAIELQEGVNIVVGPNASGKTNLLEAVYVVSQAKSFKSKSRELVQDKKDWTRIEASYKNSKRVVKVQPPKQPVLEVDNTEIRRAKRWSNLVPVVLFDPEDLRLLRGSPERRRQYLDVTMTQGSALYSKNLANYKRALAQRNKLLKNETLDPEELFVWDVKLAESGSYITAEREKFIKHLNKELSKLYSAISGKKHSIEVNYLSSGSKDSSSLLRQLDGRKSLDTSRGFTTVGPHRDDLEFFINKDDAQSHASRGETRSLVLSLKLFEADVYEKQHGVKPVMLLDDVFSELDSARRRYLTKHLKDHQTIITTTDADAVIEHFSTGEYKVIPVSKT